MKKILLTTIALGIFIQSYAQDEVLAENKNGIIRNYSPLLKLRRNTDTGGYLQGIQTQLIDESPNFYFGNLHSEQWIVTKGDYSGQRLLTIKSDGKVGVNLSEPEENLHVSGNGMIENYSPLLKLKRNSNTGGFVQGIQTQLIDGSPNYFFGNLHSGQWIITKGGYDDQRLLTVLSNGRIGIGTNAPTQKLSVDGKINAEEIILEDVDGADFVFEEDYDLRSLEETEQFIQANNHLPEIPSAAEMAEEGLEIKEMNILLLQKVEELTLHLIEQNKQIQAQQAEFEALKTKID